MIDHESKIKDALEGIPGLKSLSSSWPDDTTAFPAIVVDLAAEQTTRWYNDRPYLTELQYYVRLFARNKDDLRRMLTETDTRMAAIGYERVFRFEQNDANVKQWVTRYLTTVSAQAE
jgi:hypothetical protein